MNNIQIKSLFTNWHNVSEEQAIKYVTFLINNITTMNNEKVIEYIEKNRLKGITVDELLKGKQN